MKGSTVRKVGKKGQGKHLWSLKTSLIISPHSSLVRARQTSGAAMCPGMKLVAQVTTCVASLCLLSLFCTAPPALPPSFPPTLFRHSPFPWQHTYTQPSRAGTHSQRPGLATGAPECQVMAQLVKADWGQGGQSTGYFSCVRQQRHRISCLLARTRHWHHEYPRKLQSSAFCSL